MHDITEEAVLKREHFQHQTTENSLATENKRLRREIELLKRDKEGLAKTIRRLTGARIAAD